MTDDTTGFELPAVMKIESCEHLHAFLLSAKDRDVEIECSAVERLGGLAAQMLAVAQESWRKNGKQLTLANPSEGFQKSVMLLGLSDLILQDQVAA